MSDLLIENVPMLLDAGFNSSSYRCKHSVPQAHICNQFGSP